jgi:hypothetical protein
MQSTLNIDISDFIELNASGKVLCNERIKSGFHKEQKKRAIGFMNCDYVNTRNYCIMESETKFYNDIHLQSIP